MPAKPTMIVIGGSLILVEATAYFKLLEFLGWTYQGTLAAVAGVALISLMVSSIVAMANPQVDPVQRHRIEKVGWALILTQALANVLVSYQFSLYHLPAEVVVRFFFDMIDPDNAQRIISIIAGGVLSITSLYMWQVVATVALGMIEHKQAARQRLIELNQRMQDSA